MRLINAFNDSINTTHLMLVGVRYSQSDYMRNLADGLLTRKNSILC